MSKLRPLLSVLLTLPLFLAPAALAQPVEDQPEPVGPEAKGPEADEVKAFVQSYLEAVKGKKWAETRKVLHPKTLDSIAERKKRTGQESHPMAPWAFEKTEYYLKEFTIVTIRTAPGGAFVVETKEDIFSVPEKGIAEGDTGSYLVGKKDGHLVMVDKKRNVPFTRAGIKAGYRGYFDAPQAEAVQ